MRRKNRRRLVLRSMLATAAAVALGVGANHFLLHQSAQRIARAAGATTPTQVTVVGHPKGGGATVVETGTTAPLTDGTFLAAGSRILAQPDGHVVLSVSTGTRLTVEESGDLSIVSSGANEIFAIRAGAVRADVAKLHPGQRFIIQTPDSEVEVHGTSFRVATTDADPNCEGGTVTRVSVFEGIVTVRHAGNEAHVAAGEAWPPGCTAKRETAASRSSRRPRIASAEARATAATPDPAAPEAERIASDLREQNDAFARAFAAKRKGATADAIAAFEAFVARYPGSSLVESALVQRMRLLREVDPARAARSAEQYLSRYPHGFARTEAEALLHSAK